MTEIFELFPETELSTMIFNENWLNYCTPEQEYITECILNGYQRRLVIDSRKEASI